jgi:hypothetical protein
MFAQKPMPMKTPLYLITIFIVFISTFGCNKSDVDRQLKSVDDLMFEYPDSAYRMILNVDTNRLKSQRNIALYALLLTQAKYRVYIDQTDDSVINIAVRYFDKSDDTRYKMLSRLYSGIIHYDAKDYAASIVDLLKAEQSALLLNDSFYLGMIYRTLFSIYNVLEDGHMQYKYAKLAYDKFILSKRYETFADYELLDVGKALHNSNFDNEAIDTISKVYRKAIFINDSLLMLCSLRDLAYSYFSLKDYTKVIDCLNKFSELDSTQLTSGDLNCLGIAYIRNQDLYKAIAVNSRVKSKGYKEPWLEYEINIKLKDCKNAVNNLLEIIDNLNQRIEVGYKQEVSSAVSQYTEETYIELVDCNI